MDLSDSANALEYARATLMHNSLRQTLSGAGRLQDLRDLEQMRVDDTIVGIRFEDREVCDDRGSSFASDFPRESEISVQGQESEAVRQGTAPEIAQTAPTSRRFYWGRAAAIVLPMMLALAAWGVFHSRASSATLAAAVDSQWDSSSAHPVLGTQLPGDTLNLKAGLAKLRFASGADVVVEGPARFRIRSDNALDLDAGRLTAVVPPGAHGFSVHTPSAIAVDLGTEFGVAVEDDATTRIEVFRGKVEARPLHAIDGGATQIVTAEQVFQVTADAAGVVPASHEPSEFVRQDEFDARALAAGGSPYQRWLAYSYQLRRDPDLVAYYTFSPTDSASDRLVNLSQNGSALDGELGGQRDDAMPNWTTGRWPEKGALAFAGNSSQMVEVPAVPGGPLDFSRGEQTASPFSICIWLHGDGPQADYNGIVAKGTGLHEQYALLTELGSPCAWLRDESERFYDLRTKVVLGDGWQQFALIYRPDKGRLELYRNGVLIGTRDGAPHQLLKTSRPMLIGCREADRESPLPDGATPEYRASFAGRIDELAIFHRALSAAEVEAMYAAEKPD